MAIRIIKNTLATMPNRLRKEFVNKFAVAATDQTTLKIEKDAKIKMTDNRSVRTGNARNSIEAQKATVKLLEVIGTVIAGSPIPMPDNPSDTVAPSESYIDFIEARKPFLGPSLNKNKIHYTSNMLKALNAWTKLENRK